MMRKYVFAWLGGAAMMLAAGQGLALEIIPGEPELDGMEVVQESAAPADMPLATGRVVAVDGTAGRITLAFRPIPQLFLDGGTRVFPVADPSALKGLAAGDKVRFAIGRHGHAYTVTRIENSN